MAKKLLISLFITLLTGLHSFGQKGNVSIFNEGNWYKLAVVERGMHQLNTTYLESMGIDVSNLNPDKIKIFSTNTPGMVPQSLEIERPQLVEHKIFITGREDGDFGPTDQVLFYASGPDYYGYNSETEQFEYEKNLYSDTAFYFLNIVGEDGLRVQNQDEILLGSTHVVRWFDDYAVYEKDVTNIRSEGRDWFDKQLFNGASLEMEIPMNIEGITDDKLISFRTRALAISEVESSFDFFINGEQLLNIPIPPRPTGEYDPAGFPIESSINSAASIFPNIEENLTVGVRYNAPSTGLGNGYLDYLFLEFSRDLKLHGKSMNFRSFESTNYEICKFVIPDITTTTMVWNITNPVLPEALVIRDDEFITWTDHLKEFVVFERLQLPTPVKYSKRSNFNILGNASTEAVIVTYPAFKSEAQRLAEFHESHDGLNVAVVTTEDIYDEFSSGMQDISAIRDYMKYLYDLGDGQLKYLLLFGDCSYDYKKRFPINQNFVPVYEARESMDPIYSYSSDDYYGFLEDDEGEWIEASGFDHTMEIGIGRLPVKSREEARTMVDKIIRYETSKNVFGPWRNEIYFVADDGDSNIHNRDAERLSTMVDTSNASYNSNKVYLDAFQQEAGPPERSAATSNRLDEIFAKSGLIVNYTGHGNIDVWADEWILTKNTIRELTNRRKMPVFVTATCEFGKYDFPLEDSGGEELILNPNGGAIALLTTTRPVFAHTNFVVNRAFYESVFELVDGENPRLGDIIRKTKNNSLRGPVNRNFALLGDPMMRLAIPDFKLDITNIANESNSNDTLSALSVITVNGEVTTQTGEFVSDFNGTLTAKVFDKPSNFQTLGNENSPFNYEVRNTLLFNGEASIINGQFQFQFIVPKNISYNFDRGKISLYAVSSDQQSDASGADIDVIVGGSTSISSTDQTPPEIAIYFNDAGYKQGDDVSPNPLLLVNLKDESGINISNRGIGQNLTGILDGGDEIDLNEFYTAANDTYQEGWIAYPLSNLEPGRHEIKIKVWDTYNNFAESSVEFVVSTEAKIIFYEVYNYPNPMTTNTTFVINHDRDGEELTIDFEVFALDGSNVLTRQFRYTDPDETIDDIVWDGKDANGYSIENGIYIYRFKMKSSLDGATNEIHRRLLISN